MSVSGQRWLALVLGVAVMAAAWLVGPHVSVEENSPETVKQSPVPGDGPFYVGVGHCGACHRTRNQGSQLAIWAQGPHAQAYESLHSTRARDIALDEGVQGDPWESDECLLCHSLRYGLAAGASASGARFAYARYAREIESHGVECENCHGPGSDYMAFEVMTSPRLAREQGLWTPDENLCLDCHAGVDHAGEFDFESRMAKIAHPIPPGNRRGTSIPTPPGETVP